MSQFSENIAIGMNMLCPILSGCSTLFGKDTGHNERKPQISIDIKISLWLNIFPISDKHVVCVGAEVWGGTFREHHQGSGIPERNLEKIHQSTLRADVHMRYIVRGINSENKLGGVLCVLNGKVCGSPGSSLLLTLSLRTFSLSPFLCVVSLNSVCSVHGYC